MDQGLPRLALRPGRATTHQLPDDGGRVQRLLRRAGFGAELAEVHDFEKKLVFEGCLAVEILAATRAADAGLRAAQAGGPHRPAHRASSPSPWCSCARTTRRARSTTLWASRRGSSGASRSACSRMIPGLENAEFARYGVMHRNTYLNGSPTCWATTSPCKPIRSSASPARLTGVEGYMESAASGLLAAVDALAQACAARASRTFAGQHRAGRARAPRPPRTHPISSP